MNEFSGTFRKFFVLLPKRSLIRWLAGISLFLVATGGIAFAGTDMSGQEACHNQMRKFCEGGRGQNVGEFYRCLEKHLADLPQECQGEWMQLVETHKKEMTACGEDYRKLCGIDKDKLKAEDYEQAAEKITACVGENLGLLSDGCWEFVKETAGPLLEGMDREKLRREALKKTQRRKKVKVKGKGWVTAEAQEGDVIWYKAKERERKIVDRYPFCPEIKGKGLELVDAWRMGLCYYRVTAPWGDELIKKLEMTGTFGDLPLGGGWGMRNQFISLSSSRSGNSAENNRALKALGVIIPILDQYNEYCPEDFEAEVYVSTELSIVKTQQNVGYSGITCEKKGSKMGFVCQDGYEKSYYDKFSDRDPGYFGCVKYASCEETRPGYIDWGKTKCLECDAGGCVDYERWVELGGAICKVNFEDPSKTPPCKAYEE